jgi:hypothetical protein
MYFNVLRSFFTVAIKSESKVIGARITIKTHWLYSDEPNPASKRLIKLLLERKNCQLQHTAETDTRVKKEVG